MPICGFNQKMIEGLNSFHKGLVEAIMIRVSDKTIVEKEIDSVGASR